jgi:hypothetical protein
LTKVNKSRINCDICTTCPGNVRDANTDISLKKVATDAIKDGVSDIKMGFEDFKETATDFESLKDSFADFFGFVGRIFTSNEEFVPEVV